MISPEKISDILPPAREAMASFVEMVMGKELTIDIQPPHVIDDPRLEERADESFALLGRSRQSEPFIVLLDTGWLHEFSRAMLEETLTEWNDAADDLMTELATQAYSAAQQALSTYDVSLEEANFTILPEIVALPTELLPEHLAEISFTAQNSQLRLEGHLLVPVAGPATDAASNAPSSASKGPIEEAPDESESQAAASGRSGPTETTGGAVPEDDGQVDVAFPSFPDFDEAQDNTGNREEPDNFELLGSVKIELSVELGRRQMPLSDILRLTNGSIVELDKLAGEPLRIYANNHLIAEGEAVVIDDQFGVRITRLAASENRARALL